jgi:endogenous inhibitor of DNA gyrase (YacG/DUF329 family)
VDVTDTAFPYLSATTAYILARDSGEIIQVWPTGPRSTEIPDRCISDVIREVQAGTARLFAVWPGEWRSDVFTIDPDALLADLDAHAEAMAEKQRAQAQHHARLDEERRNRPKQRCPRCGRELRVRDDGSLYPHNSDRHAKCNGGSAGEMAAIRREREAAERQRGARERWERETAERRAQRDAEYSRLNEEFQAGRLEGHAKKDGSLCSNSLTVNGGPRCSLHEVGAGELAQYEAKLDARAAALSKVAP